MTLKREDIKKLIIQQMLQESIQEEGAVTNWLRSKVSAGAQAGGEKLTKFGQRIAPKPEEDPEFLQDLSKIADFIQMFRNNKTVTDSDFYKKFVMGMQEQVNEQYQSQFLKQILSKKPTIADVEGFVKNVSSSPALHKNLKSLELKKIEVPDTTLSTKSAPPEQKVVNSPATVQSKKEPTIEPSSPKVPDLVPGTEVTTKKAKIKFLPPVEDTPTPAAAQEIAKTSADRMAELKRKFDSGGLKADEKEELLNLLGIGKSQKKRKRRAEESLQEAIVEEIFNLLTGKTK